ncbi:hypothetical protein [Saccharopolyspora elongata]|uniref:hypothetical protein n=1 Tax=Saccharopolyspora elongata TaxID=2530387 RepID=UPI00140434E1|nr:hypothetical protein [Saccharopolyspora elongata]
MTAMPSQGSMANPDDRAMSSALPVGSLRVQAQCRKACRSGVTRRTSVALGKAR